MVENPIQAGWKMEQGIKLTAGLDWFVCKLLRDYNCWEKVSPVLISSSLKHFFFDSVLQNWFYSTLIWLFVSMNLMCGFCKIKKHSRIWSRSCIPKPKAGKGWRFKIGGEACKDEEVISTRIGKWASLSIIEGAKIEYEGGKQLYNWDSKWNERKNKRKRRKIVCRSYTRAKTTTRIVLKKTPSQNNSKNI